MISQDEYDLIGFWCLQIGLELCGVQTQEKASEILCTPLEMYMAKRSIIIKSFQNYFTSLEFCSQCNKLVAVNGQNQCRFCNWDIPITIAKKKY